ncbi:threonine/homoserine/homoserine lactone efflux protein [Thiopseudomonas denitrificans]|uniref:Threonine/homoserine/homoserine lactone efflux protein n=2 Tax=Thiopseudomonas denitrificans TaxID=1501432 RepID=A0A4R6TQJ6_9GAMM|nr:threonine/homoserine/homoserine lactone efflux protein [Thiopseudomonas denitrificans]
MESNLMIMFMTVALAHFLALLSPGPDFVLVVKSAIRNDRSKAIGVAAGISTANALYIALCLIGVGALLASSIWLMVTLKIIGGLFLIFLAIQALRAKRSAYAQLSVENDQIKNGEASFIKEFVTGFMSGILNPKNLLFYLSLFTVVLTNDVGLVFKIALGVWMTLVVFFWDTAIIFMLSTNKARSRFTKLAYYIDKLTGAILGLVGISIVKSAFAK